MKKYKTLIIDNKTIKRLITITEALREVEKAFNSFGKGKTQMPAKVYIHLDKDRGDFRAMPAYIDKLKACGIKWVNVHALNRKKGLPTVMAVLILSDPCNGLPLCIMDATYVTSLRTGAAGGVAAKYLARRSSKTVALVGCGVQAQMQLNALLEIFDIKHINVCGYRLIEAQKFIRQQKKKINPALAHKGRIKFESFSTVKKCVKDSDIVVTTTPSRRPLVKLEWLKKGVHINAIGADAKGKQELDPKILKKGKIVVDSWEQACHSGEINVPLTKKQLSKKDIYADIGQIVAGKKKGRIKKDEITIFDSTGLAIQDIAIAHLVNEKARKLGKGKYINIGAG